MRAFVFSVCYWVITVTAALSCAALALMPGRKPLAMGLRGYGAAMLFAMRWVAGIRVEVRGRERLPDGSVVVAAKHQSWGDGFVMLAHLPDLAFVAGKHLYRYPLLRGILRKAGAVVLDNEGGEAARAMMAEGLERLQNDGRKLLIYPEGHLAAVGEKHRYRKGVYHLYKDLERPCAPVATNLGLAWPQQSFWKRPGRVVVEFLDPIEPGLDKETFMARLESVIETRSNALVAGGLS